MSPPSGVAGVGSTLSTGSARMAPIRSMATAALPESTSTRPICRTGQMMVRTSQENSTQVPTEISSEHEIAPADQHHADLQQHQRIGESPVIRQRAEQPIFQ